MMFNPHTPIDNKREAKSDLTALKCVSLAATTLLLAACATSPDRSEAPTIDLPTAWTSQSFNAAPTAWLADFDSPQLEALVLEALAKSPSLKATAARFAQSIAELRISGAKLKPTSELGLNSARQKINTFGPNSTGGVIFENYNLALDLSWEVDLWGRLRDQTSAAVSRAEGYQADLDAARLSLAAQITKGWLNLIEAKQQLALSEHTAKTYRDNQRALESRFKLGLAKGFDLRRIITQAASAEAETFARQRSLDQAVRQLEVFLGRYPAGALDAINNFPNLPPTIPVGLPANLIQRRPDLVSAERQLAATDRELRASKKDLLPKISLTASGGTSSQEFENLLDGDFGVWTLVGNLTQPIFQGGRILANIDRNTALRDQAAANYHESALRAFLEVETTLAAEQFIRRERAKLAIAAEEATATEALAWDRYRTGIGDFLSALDAKRTADVARSRLLSVSNIFFQNRVDLYLALGGAFESKSLIKPPSDSAKNLSSTNGS